jgi:5-methylcytosine-specific restriction endonuclease McrA
LQRKKDVLKFSTGGEKNKWDQKKKNILLWNFKKRYCRKPDAVRR